MYWWKIKDWFWNLKMKKERAKYGFSREDTWDISYWFLNIVPKILKKMNETRVGHPGDMTDEEWDKIINRMIFCLNEANEDTCSQKNKFEIERNKKQWFEREVEIEKYRDKMKDEGLKLFSEHFWQLWD